MENKGAFVFLISLFVLMVLGLIFVVAFGTKSYHPGSNGSILNYKNDSKTCVIDNDCVDEDSCVLNYCDEGKCAEANVVLCYQNDGCCPSGCNSETDNDCLV